MVVSLCQMGLGQPTNQPNPKQTIKHGQSFDYIAIKPSQFLRSPPANVAQVESAVGRRHCYKSCGLSLIGRAAFFTEKISNLPKHN